VNDPGRWAGVRRTVFEILLVWAIAVTLLALMVMGGCRADGWSRVASTTEVGVGSRTERALDEADYVWVSVRPLAFLEPPTPVYDVPPPAAEYLKWRSPLTAQEQGEPQRRPWWWQLERVKGLLGWVGAGLAAFVLLVLGKLGWDKSREKG